MKLRWATGFVLLMAGFGHAGETVLDNYIREALAGNPALRQREFSLEQSLAALAEARGYFMPSLSIHARYTRAGGGRTIDFPVGDLFNPIYSTLNALTGSSLFPTDLENEIIPFLREREHESALRVVQPVFDPSILYNFKIKKRLTNLQRASRDIYRRQLVLDLKTAYLNVLKLKRIERLYSETEAVLAENVRVSEKLVQVQKGTAELLHRAQTELSLWHRKMAELERQRELSIAYLNYLCHRPMDDPVVEMTLDDPPAAGNADFSAVLAEALDHREEMEQIEWAIAAASGSVNLRKGAFLPSLAVAVDYGYQGEKYRFGADDDYWMASAVLSWNLFNGFSDRARVQSARLEVERLRAQKEEIRGKIELELRDAVQRIAVSRKALAAARKGHTSARKSFDIVKAKYEQGMAPQIEFLDARTSHTAAELELILTRYDLHISRAQLERAAAQFELPGEQ